MKQTGSVEQTFYQGWSSFLNLYATALASSLGREVWEPFALLSVTGTHPNIRFPPLKYQAPQWTIIEGCGIIFGYSLPLSRFSKRDPWSAPTCGLKKNVREWSSIFSISFQLWVLKTVFRAVNSATKFWRRRKIFDGKNFWKRIARTKSGILEVCTSKPWRKLQPQRFNFETAGFL